jgi:branched-chain amino acid transport system substrate-binding protein
MNTGRLQPRQGQRVLLLALCIVLILSTISACATAPAEKKTVKISWIGPLTGGNAGPGLGGRNSFQLAINERNADPKARYKYEAVIIDDECKPDVGVQAALKATSDPAVVASASHYCSMVAISTVDTFHNAGVPSMVWGAVLPDITYGNNYEEVFRVNGTMIQQNQVHAQMMWDWGFRKVSIIHDTSDYGRGHLKYFSEAFQKLGGKILSAQGVTTDQQDFTAELTKIKAEQPDVIYFGGLTPVGTPLRKQMVKLDIKAQFDGTSGIKNDSFNDALKGDAEGVISFLEGAPLDELPGGAAFKKAYEAAGMKEPPEAYGPFAYTAAVLIMDAIEKVGPDRKKVMQELATIKDKDTIIGKVTMDSYGQNIVPLVTAYVSQDGKWVPWKQSEYASGKRTLPGLVYMKERGGK